MKPPPMPDLQPPRPPGGSGPERVPRRRVSRPARGLSLVELLIGIALGLFLIAGGLAVVSSHAGDHRQLVLEARLHQDLRAAAEAITRDLRRAGHWGEPGAGLWAPDAPARPNPYAPTLPDGAGADQALLSYSRDAQENHRLDANEQFGVRLRNQVIELLLGQGNWQALTDPGTVLVSHLQLSTRAEAVASNCDRACPPTHPGAPPCPPQLLLREVTVDITGRSPLDRRIERSLRTRARLRNDELVGACPG